METGLVLELVGYLASVLVAVSLMMRSVLRLRVINLLGALVFTVYGVLIAAYPVAAVNLLIVGINLWHLRRMLGSRERFDVLEVDAHSPYLRRFLDFHRDDIERFAPGAGAAAGEGRIAFFVLRDTVPAGLFVAEPRGDGVLRVVLDYVTPQYRDFRTGRFLFGERAAIFRERGFRVLESAPGSAVHEAYLRRMGFTREGDAYRRPLA
jgi:hypothetical protein